MKARRLFAALLVSILASCRGSRGGAGAHAAVRAGGGPIVLISIDTLRADHLPAYGYKGLETPAIERLRRDGILFEKVWSQCPLTLPSHVSIFTGLLPPQHGVRNNIGYRLDAAAHPTLARLLKQRGYATGAFVSAWVVRSQSGLIFGQFYLRSIAAERLVKGRARRLRERGEIALRQHLDQQIGCRRQVLVESRGLGRIEQFTPVRLDQPFDPGRILELEMTGHDGRQLIAA